MRRFKDKEIGQAGIAQEQRDEAVVSLHWIGGFVKGCWDDNEAL